MRNSNIFNIMYHFPNVPKELFKFSSDNLTPTQKYYEFRDYVKILNKSDKYWDESMLMSKFLYNLYKENILTTDYFLYESLLGNTFIMPGRMEGNLSKLTLDCFNSITEYCDFRYKLIVSYNKFLEENPDHPRYDYFTSKFISTNIVNFEADIVFNNYGSNIVESIYDRFILIIKYMVYYCFYSEYEYNDLVKSKLKENENELIKYLKGFFYGSMDEEPYKYLFSEMPLDDLVMIQAFFDSIEDCELIKDVEPRKMEVLIKIKDIVNTISEERGLLNE